MPLYLVRHAPVTVEETCYGQIDVPTAIGPQQALDTIKSQLPKDFRDIRVWSSPLTRCAELAQAFSRSPTFDPRLMEASFGLWEGLTWDEIHRKSPTEMDQWGLNWVEQGPPKGESAMDVQVRVADWISSLRPGIHLGFTHAGVIRAARVILKCQTWAESMDKPTPYLGIEVFNLPATKT